MQVEKLLNKTRYKPIQLLFYCIVFICTFVHNRVTKILQYPNTDEYFDRIYVLKNGNNQHYLRIYCKQHNMISLSITEQLEFTQYPRFSIHSPEKETPRMQRKIYTFWQSCNVNVKINQESSIVKIIRKGTQQTVFTINEYIWSQSGDIQISTTDYSTKWGMGQRFQSNFAIKDGIWTVWNRDRPWEIDRGSNMRSGQTYGHQPVYLAKSSSSPNFHLVYLKNTHGFNLQSSEQSKKLKYNIVGGHIHFIIILGTNPEELVKQYHNYIGPAMVPPFWSLGYHQSRWGYRNFQQFSQVVKQFQKHNLPLDTMWSDLDYMKSKQIFTVDQNNYPPRKMQQLMRQKRINYIPLIDAGVAISDRIGTQEGIRQKIFLKSLYGSQQDYVGAVWPGKVHFVDYLHPNASLYWHSQLERLYEQIPFSGVWLDMNQPSNFQGNQYNIQVYRIQHAQSMNMMTIDVNLNHYCSRCSLKHKQIHAYFGHMTTVPTYEFLKKKNGRPFIISRSNSVGTGVYAGHWTGDNVADWQFLRLSISGNFLFQIFGIQMVGADICGFHRNTNQELCSRWMQVGSFYPFARNHNENESIPQEPYQFGNKLLETTRASFYQRYSLIKQMYSTLLNLNGTGTFYRPLFFQFPEDRQSYSQKFTQTEFMIGDYLLGAPIVQQGKQSRQVYFPKSLQGQLWYQLTLDKNLGVTAGDRPILFRSQSTSIITNQLPSAPPIFLRSGRLIFVNMPAMRVADLTNSYSIIAALNLTEPRSTGKFLAANNFTDNTQIDLCVQKGCIIQFSLYKQNGNNYILEWNEKGNAALQIDIKIDKITIYNQDRMYKSSKTINIRNKQGRQIITVS